MKDRPANSSGIGVEVRNLRKSFAGQPVLKGIDLSVKPGEIFVVMGPSGTGKTVLLRHIIGLETPDQGEILIGDQKVEGPGILEKFRIAMVFQSSALLSSLTVGENVGLYLAEHRTRTPEEIDRIVREKLELVGLKNVEQKYPSELSGGMTKRVAIARALVIEPQLILYDEPTSELDPLSAVTIIEEILGLRAETHATSIVVSHDRNLAFGIADRIAIIEEGRILFAGTPEEVRANPNPTIQEFITANFKK